ncbi:hypothetical protein H2248_008998 [Termitomyces sp. 'cryptogamus']|nr:hypothetical protein H2248_008998 [Termitomyces sp. 'cryptogamus']
MDKTTVEFLVFTVICCLAFYVFATVAPLINRCVPYGTPFSTLLWYLRRRAMRMIFRVNDENESLSGVCDGLESPSVDTDVSRQSLGYTTELLMIENFRSLQR